MSAPRIGQGMPANESYFTERLGDLQRQINELRSAQGLAAASVAGDGISSANFDGTLNPPTVGTQGWGLAGATGTAIFGTLLLRGGIIGDDALANPAAFAAGHDDADAFPLSHTVGTTVCTVLLPVPAGFSTALVLGISDMTVDAGTTAGAEATVITAINGATTPFGNSVTLPVNDQRAVSNSFAKVLTGLAGGNVTVITEVASTGVDIPAGGGTWANLAALAVFLR